MEITLKNKQKTLHQIHFYGLEHVEKNECCYFIYCTLRVLPSHTDWRWSSIRGTAGKRRRGPQVLGGRLGREARPRRLSGYCPLQVKIKSRTILVAAVT